MSDTHTPIMIDEVNSTDVYVATLELRSVGTSKNMFPVIKFSHHFTAQPDFIPYSYRAIMQIAEKIGAVIEERELPEVQSDADLDAHAKAADAALQEKEDDSNS